MQHEKHKAKKNPENADAHNKKQEIAAAVAAGASVLVLHERHEKKDAKKQQCHN